MADLNFPQIPASVWWRLREKFKKSIPSTVSSSFLGSELGVQETAAKAYINQLIAFGLLNEDGTPSKLANPWRMDDTYRETANEILKNTYPRELLDLSPPGETDRDKITRWFMGQGLGKGSAGNRAATYLLVSSAEIPDDIQVKVKTAKPESIKVAKLSPTPKSPKKSAEKSADFEDPRDKQIPLNVNVQIHISADASSDQIEAIFANMKKYLR